MNEQVRYEWEQERAGLHKRIMDLYDALDRANARTERVFAMKAYPPIFMSADALGKMMPSAGTIVCDEMSAYRDIYFKDFLRSWWKRHLRR